MSVAPEEAYPFSAAQTPPPSAEEEQISDAPMSAEEEAALCARYKEEKQRMDNAETSLGSDWPEGPLCACGCGW